MSAIASFILFPTPALADLRAAAIPKKRLFGGVKDEYPEFLVNRGREAAQFGWSGYVLGTLLPYLAGRKSIDLMKPDFEGLASYLCEARGDTNFVLSNVHKQAFLGQLSSLAIPEEELRDFFNEFNASKETRIGVA